ncbi:hypothetical protein M9Y10_038406 [Tritrichomonas musculus]|uniref:Uncharacterized protein n=1 Tax=Tritrichomonas musculus TaxID=1915356 RepID=A0ABR2K8B8_9EUKA
MKNLTQSGNHHQRADSSLSLNEQDSITSMIKNNNIYYLGYVGGNISDIPKKVTDSPPKNTNIHMWTRSQLISLHSDLINLAVYYDKIDESIQQIQEKSLGKFLSELHEEELQQPLGYFRISTNPSESEDTFDDNMSPVREKTPTLQEERRKESRRRHTSDRVKSLGRTEQATESQQEKMNKQDLIWDNTDIFMKSIPNISKFSSILAPSEPVKYPPTILTDPFGPHYSITIPQDTELFADDPNKARLILPPPPSLDARPKGVFAQMHTRLISSFVNITPNDIEQYLKETNSSNNNDNDNKSSKKNGSNDNRRSDSNKGNNKDHGKSESNNYNLNSNASNKFNNKSLNARNYDLHRGQELINNLFSSNEHNNFINSDDDENNYSDDNNEGNSSINSSNNNSNVNTTQIIVSSKAAPVPTGLGIAPYGLLEFDDKLKLELQSLEFTSSDLSMVYVDSPVSKNIEYRVMRQDELVANTNKIKERMSKLLQSRKDAFEEEIAYKKNWDDALRRFLDNQANKQQQQQPQKQKKKKKTDS